MPKQIMIAVSGVKNSGKTTLIEKLIPLLSMRGLSSAVIKHDGHSFEPDREGTDTFKALRAGAVGTAVFDGEKLQAVKYISTSETELAALFPEADIILLEGFKHSSYPKLEVVRRGVSDKSVCDPNTLLAIVTDTSLSVEGVPTVNIDDTDGLADIVYAFWREMRP